MERPQQFLFTPRVIQHQFLRNKLGVRYVAPTATRHFHFGEHFFPTFQNCNLQLRILLRDVNGRKKTGSTATNNKYIFLYHNLSGKSEIMPSTPYDLMRFIGFRLLTVHVKTLKSFFNSSTISWVSMV